MGQAKDIQGLVKARLLLSSQGLHNAVTLMAMFAEGALFSREQGTINMRGCLAQPQVLKAVLKPAKPGKSIWIPMGLLHRASPEVL